MGDAAVPAMVVEEEEQEHVFRSRFPPVAVPDGVTVPEFVLDGAEAYADRVALVEAAAGGRSYTYGEVARDTARFARALRSVGVRKGTSSSSRSQTSPCTPSCRSGSCRRGPCSPA